MSQGIVTVLPRSTLRGQIVSKVLDSIFARELKGGDRLIEEELALKLGVSRTPIREALNELAGIGVIQIKPNLGAVVLPFGPRQLREIYHVRRLLEQEATRLAVKNISREELEAIREQSEALFKRTNRGRVWSETVMDLDQRFHELISRSCGNERLAAEIARYRILIQSIRRALGNRGSAQVDALTEHIRVIDHLLADDGEKAGQEMAGHIHRGAETAAAAVFSNGVHRAGLKSDVLHRFGEASKTTIGAPVSKYRRCP
jgi:DNA-binding GntR family transcriptional regulator